MILPASLPIPSLHRPPHRIDSDWYRRRCNLFAPLCRAHLAKREEMPAVVL